MLLDIYFESENTDIYLPGAARGLADPAGKLPDVFRDSRTDSGDGLIHPDTKLPRSGLEKLQTRTSHS